MRKILLTFSFLVSLASYSQSIGGSFESIIAAGENDANVLMRSYMQPVMEGLVYSMNGGWYHTAKTHKSFGFDITVTGNASMVPTEREMFRISDLEFENTVTGNPDTTPTVMGSGDASTITFVNEETGQSVQFDMPEGIKEDLPLNAVPMPTFQASIGLVWDTDVIVRYTPEVGNEEVKGDVFGIGVKHGLMQYFGPLEKLPLNVSVIGGYSSMNVAYDFEDGSTFEGEGQRATLELSSYNVQALASLDFPIITLYGGVGYSTGTSKLKVLGTYEVEYEVAGVPTGSNETYTDPINLEYDPSGARATIGARLNLAFFKIFADYTVQEYNTLSAGIALSFR